jgi:HK97 family phage portal protein
MKGAWPVASFLRTLLGRTTPVPFAPRRSTALSFGHHTNATAQLRTMGSNGTLFAIVNRIANATGQLEWHLYRKAPSGRKEDRVEVTHHAALDLWNKPNRFYTQSEFVEAQQQHQELTGEGWWVAARNPRSPIPLELWPVRPDRMMPVPSAENYLSGYIYTAPDGEQIPLGLEDVIFLRTPNPMDAYRGMGPVQSILVDLDAARYSAEWNRNFFINSAEPGGIIKVEKRLSDTEFDEMRLRWNEQHRGVAAAHRVAILEQGEWVDRKFSQKDMQFAELRGISREVIREAFGFPKPLLGATDDVNRANAEAAEVVFARWLIVSRARRMRDALNYDLLPMFGLAAEGLEFDFDNPVPDDREAASNELTARATAAAALIAAGFAPADVLSVVGLPAMAFSPPSGSPPSAPNARLELRG